VKRVLIMAVTLVTLLSFTACGGETQEEESLPSAQEVVDGVVDSMTNTTSYQFEMGMTVDMTGEAEGETFDMNMDMDGSGVIDLEANDMMMDMSMNMAVPGEDEIDMDMAMYLVEGMLYMKMTNPILGGPPMWMKFEVPEEALDEMSAEINQTQLYLEMFETGQVEVTGSATVDGIDCYVVEIIPDIEQLWQLAMDQMQLAGQVPADITDIGIESFPEILKSFSVKYWIAKDTYYIAKADMDMALEITPEAVGYPEEEGIVNMDMKISMLMYDYNQPVDIILPPEAENAAEVPMPES
jgi:hypothetical protein